MCLFSCTDQTITWSIHIILDDSIAFKQNKNIVGGKTLLSTKTYKILDSFIDLFYRNASYGILKLLMGKYLCVIRRIHKNIITKTTSEHFSLVSSTTI